MAEQGSRRGTRDLREPDEDVESGTAIAKLCAAGEMVAQGFDEYLASLRVERASAAQVAFEGPALDVLCERQLIEVAG